MKMLAKFRKQGSLKVLGTKEKLRLRGGTSATANAASTAMAAANAAAGASAGAANHSGSSGGTSTPPPIDD